MKIYRPEAGEALIKVIMASLWEDRNEQKLKHRGHFKGFAIMSRLSSVDGATPYVYLRGKQTYEANLNTENALGTIASIENALHRLDRFAEDEKSDFERMEKALVDFTEQLNRPFEHEERLRELFVKQQEINRSLDLDKGDTQVVADDIPQEDKGEYTGVERLTARRTARGQAVREVRPASQRTTVESNELVGEPSRT